MKQRNRKSPKITDAIIRGDKNTYEFEVFPIETEFEPQPAVYIFSRRKTDKMGRGHQRFFYVGQTSSLDGDFSKYKKDYASKQKANVICVYVEDEENARLKIEEEIKTAHTMSPFTEAEIKAIKTIKAVAPAKKIAAAPQIEDAVEQDEKPTRKTVSRQKVPASKAKKIKDVNSKHKKVKVTLSVIKTQSKKTKPVEIKSKTKDSAGTKSKTKVSRSTVSKTKTLESKTSKPKTLKHKALKSKDLKPAGLKSKTSKLKILKPKNQPQPIKAKNKKRKAGSEAKSGYAAGEKENCRV